jgi:hypothetical protein
MVNIGSAKDQHQFAHGLLILFAKGRDVFDSYMYDASCYLGDLRNVFSWFGWAARMPHLKRGTFGSPKSVKLYLQSLVQVVRDHWQRFGLVTKAFVSAGCAKELICWGCWLAAMVVAHDNNRTFGRKFLTPLEKDALTFLRAHMVRALVSAVRLDLPPGTLEALTETRMAPVLLICSAPERYWLAGCSLSVQGWFAALAKEASALSSKAPWWWAFGEEDREFDCDVTWQEEMWLRETRAAVVSAAFGAIHLYDRVLRDPMPGGVHVEDKLWKEFLKLTRHVRPVLRGVDDAFVFSRADFRRTDPCPDMPNPSLVLDNTDLLVFDDPCTGPVAEQLLGRVVGRCLDVDRAGALVEKLAPVLAAYLARSSFWSDLVLRAVREVGVLPAFRRCLVKGIAGEFSSSVRKWSRPELEFWWCAGAARESCGALNTWRSMILDILLADVIKMAEEVGHSFEHLNYDPDPYEDEPSVEFQLGIVRHIGEAHQRRICAYVDITGHATQLQAAVYNVVSSTPALVEARWTSDLVDQFCAEYRRWTSLRRAWVSAVYRAVVAAAVRRPAQTSTKRRKGMQK